MTVTRTNIRQLLDQHLAVLAGDDRKTAVFLAHTILHVACGAQGVDMLTTLDAGLQLEGPVYFIRT